MKTGRRLLLIVPFVLAAACGDDDASTTEAETEAAEPYVAAVAESLIDPDDADEEPIEPEGAECFATRLVAIADPVALEEAGITPEEFADADSFADLDLDLGSDAVDEVSDALRDCVGDQLAETFAAEFSSSDASAEAPDCLVDALADGPVYDAVAEQLVQGEAALADEEVAAVVIENAPASCLEEAFVAEGVADGDITEEEAACIRDELDDDVARSVLLDALGDEEPSPEDMGAITEAIEVCGAAD